MTFISDALTRPDINKTSAIIKCLMETLYALFTRKGMCINMEVIICSNDKKRLGIIREIADNVIADKRLRLMSLHTSAPSSTSELLKCFKNERGYLVIIDTVGYSGWKELMTEISKINRRAAFCVIAENNDAAADIINMMLNVCGYINSTLVKAKPLFEELFVRIYGRIVTLCGGIMTCGRTDELKVIKFEDIYYIETLKQQHRCTIFHKNGSDEFRADISKLIKSLDGRFEITRSSTVANLANASGIINGMLIFYNGSLCSITKSRHGFIKKIMAETAVI